MEGGGQPGVVRVIDIGMGFKVYLDIFCARRSFNTNNEVSRSPGGDEDLLSRLQSGQCEAALFVGAGVVFGCLHAHYSPCYWAMLIDYYSADRVFKLCKFFGRVSNERKRSGNRGVRGVSPPHTPISGITSTGMKHTQILFVHGRRRRASGDTDRLV